MNWLFKNPRLAAVEMSIMSLRSFHEVLSDFQGSNIDSPPSCCHEMDLQAAFAFRRCKIFMLPFWKEVR